MWICPLHLVPSVHEFLLHLCLNLFREESTYLLLSPTTASPVITVLTCCISYPLVYYQDFISLLYRLLLNIQHAIPTNLVCFILLNVKNCSITVLQQAIAKLSRYLHQHVLQMQMIAVHAYLNFVSFTIVLYVYCLKGHFMISSSICSSSLTVGKNIYWLIHHNLLTSLNPL